MLQWIKSNISRLCKSKKRKRTEQEQVIEGNLAGRQQPPKRQRFDQFQQEQQNQLFGRLGGGCSGDMHLNSNSNNQNVIFQRKQVRDTQHQATAGNNFGKQACGKVCGTMLGSSSSAARRTNDDMLGNQVPGATATKLDLDQIAEDQFSNMFKVNKNIFEKTEQIIRQFKAQAPSKNTNGKQKKRNQNQQFTGISFRKNLHRYNQLKQKEKQIKQQEKELLQNKLQLQEEMEFYQKNFQNYIDTKLMRPQRSNHKNKQTNPQLLQNQLQVQKQLVENSKDAKLDQPDVKFEVGVKQAGSQTRNQTPFSKILQFDDGSRLKEEGVLKSSNSKQVFDDEGLESNQSEKQIYINRLICSNDSGKQVDIQNKQKQQVPRSLNGFQQVQKYRMQIDDQSDELGSKDEQWETLCRRYQQVRRQREQVQKSCVPKSLQKAKLQLQQLSLGQKTIIQEDDQVVSLDSGKQDDGLDFQNGLGSSESRSKISEVRIASAEMESMYKDLTDPRNGCEDQNIRFHEFSRIQLKRKSLRTLGPAGWLDDEIINTFMGIFQERSMVQKQENSEVKQWPRCHFFNSFFLNRLYKDSGSYNYSNVHRWTLPKKLKKHGYQSVLDTDRIIVPVHLGNHWTCAMIDLHAKRIRYYDSMNGNDRGVLVNLRTWLKDEFQSKKKLCIDENEFEMDQCRQIPQQNNGYDCGVFTIMFADYLSRGKSFEFGQKDMVFFRKKMVFELMTQISAVEDPASIEG